MSDRNPWLHVSARDYEGHMAHPAVGQLRFLADLLDEFLMALRPRRVALLGCATGNGLERVDPAEVDSVLGVDINAEYLAVAERRHRPQLGERLRLECADLGDPIAAASALSGGGFDLIHAPLLFEYLEPERLLPVLAHALTPAGTLVVLLQLPSAGQGAVTDTPYTGVQVLESLLRLVAPETFAAAAEAAGLTRILEEARTLPTGKAFHLSLWRRA